MYINKSLLILLFLFFVICSAYAGNIGRNVYGVYSESLTGVNFDTHTYCDDSVRMWPDNGMVISSMTTGGVEEGLVYVRCKFSTSAACWLTLGFVNSSNESQAKDMSAYHNGTLKFLVRVSSGAECASIYIGLTLNGNTFFKPLNDLVGFSSNTINKWQEVSMALSSTTSSTINYDNLGKTSSLFSISSTRAINDSSFSLDFDYIRWVKPNTTTDPGDFSVKLKNLSNNSDVSTSSITWSSTTFQQGWRVAEQFLEIDYDVDSSTRNWNVKLYTNNGNKLRNGLYAINNGKDYVMTMCWRASEKALPYTDYNGAHTLYIAQGHNSTDDYDYLYDSGSSSTVFAPWLYMQDLSTLEGAPDKDKDYSTVMGHKKGGNSGYHAYSGKYDDVSYNGYYSGSKVNLYLGANCDVGGLKYEGNIVVALEYE